MLDLNYKCWYNYKVNAGVAQLVEQLIRNQQVVGSSPIFSSIYLRLFGGDFLYLCTH